MFCGCKVSAKQRNNKIFLDLFIDRGHTFSNPKPKIRTHPNATNTKTQKNINSRIHKLKTSQVAIFEKMKVESKL